MIDSLVKFPTRSRPELFFDTLAKWMTDPTVRFLVSIDADDPTCNNQEFRQRFHGATIGRGTLRVGNSKSKVEAINDGVAEEPWDFLVLGSDDMVPQRPDYASHLRTLLFHHFPDGDGVLHVNDGRAGRALNTLPVMGRKYFDRFNYIYHGSYTSVWCDNEYHAVAESLGKSAWVEEVVMRHAWRDLTGADALHVRNESFYEQDGWNFGKRQTAGFPH